MACVQILIPLLYKFDTVLYQFFETGTSDRTLTGLDQLLRNLGFTPYPFHFSFKAPLNSRTKERIKAKLQMILPVIY